METLPTTCSVGLKFMFHEPQSKIFWIHVKNITCDVRTSDD